MSLKVPQRILVTRTDRLGDVILATPVLKELRKRFPDSQITLMVQESWIPVLQYGSEISILSFQPKTSLKELTELLSARGFDRVYVLRDEPLITKAVRKAKIPERIGPYSTLRSLLSFNYGRFQKRSRCRLHESEYNLDLVHPQLAADREDSLPRAWVATSAEAKSRAQQYLLAQGLLPQKFVVIHPGSSGSARYVKIEVLYALARRILLSGRAVCISGGPAEAEILVSFQRAVPEVKLLGAGTAIGLDGMAEVYRQAQAVIAHGTGPLHLAAAVGAPTLAIFPPIFVLSEKRWGPLSSKRAVWVPNVPCPAKYRCHGPKCSYYDCMDLFNVEAAMNLLEKVLS